MEKGGITLMISGVNFALGLVHLQSLHATFVFSWHKQQWTWKYALNELHALKYVLR